MIYFHYLYQICFNLSKFRFTNLFDNLNADEVIVIDSHDDIFKKYQIQYWRKDRISDIFPAINCPSFKSETRIFKTSEIGEIIYFIHDQDLSKSIVIEKSDKNLSINLVYGDTLKITPKTLYYSQNTTILDQLKERYKLWEIGDCACKPKKIRVRERKFEQFKNTIDELEWISNINNIKLWVDIYCEVYYTSLSNCYSIIFNHSTIWMSDKEPNFIFKGDTLAVVYKGNYYNFRLDQETMDYKNSYIKGKI